MTRWIRIILSVTLVAVLVCGMAGCMAEAAPVPEAGSIVTFGRYPQTEEGTDETPIEWIVLEVDEENHRALLLSKYGLDTIPYHTQNIDVTWETCTLRSWLNDDFLNRAFSAEEQSAILLTDVDNSSSQGYSEWKTSGGNNTQDYIFLLSYAEANCYLNVTVTWNDNHNRASRVAPTDYAIEQGASTRASEKTAEGRVAGWWWLRSPGNKQHSVAYVNYDGTLHKISSGSGYGCVRPAFWINLESDIF